MAITDKKQSIFLSQTNPPQKNSSPHGFDLATSALLACRISLQARRPSDYQGDILTLPVGEVQGCVEPLRLLVNTAREAASESRPWGR